MPARLLPAPVPDTATVAHVPLDPRRAYLYLLAGAGVTLLTHYTNPGALSWLGGLVVLVLLHGPSPRAWGSPVRALLLLVLSRSIPTCVGLTVPRSRGGSG